MAHKRAAEQAPAVRVLVVDDEVNIRTALVRMFLLEGYRAEAAESGAQALAMLQQARFDVMVVDLNMPGMGGVEVMEQARRHDADLLMVVLTGHATLESAIAAVKLEAVDYVQKPASLAEISAVVANALRARNDDLQRKRLLNTIGEAMDALRLIQRSAAAAAQPVAPGAPALPFELDLEKRQVAIVARPGSIIELTESEAALLATLLSQADQVLTCRQLVRLTWDYDLDEWEAQSVVRPHIFRLRRKLEADPEHPRFIKTVRGRGYLFARAG